MWGGGGGEGGQWEGEGKKTGWHGKGRCLRQHSLGGAPKSTVSMAFRAIFCLWTGFLMPSTVAMKVLEEASL